MEQKFSHISTCMYVLFFFYFLIMNLQSNIFKVHEWRMGTDRVKSKIEIDPATQMDAGVYECTADNMYSIDRRSFKTDFSIVFD